MAFLELNNLNKIFGKAVAVNDFNLQVEKGELVSFLGPSGCGKTTTLRMVAGFEIPTTGTIKVNGLDITSNPPNKRNVGMVAISANDIANYPDDAPKRLKEMAEQTRFTFPFCYDESQATARAYAAACTPDFFVFDKDRRLAYRGQMDASRPGNNAKVTGKDLRVALDAVLEGNQAPIEQRPSIGCNIKWRPGNEPEYFG